MTIPDSPALDLDALTALEQAATPAPWRLDRECAYDECAVYSPNGAVGLAWSLDDAELIAAARNALPALLSALAAARGERDHYLRSFSACCALNDRVHAKVREQYDVIAHAKKQRDEAIEQAKQAQAVVTAAYKFADDMALFCSPHGVSYRYAEQLRAALDEAGATSAAAPKATCSCQWSPVQGRIWCDSCTAARDAVVEAAAAPQADEPKPATIEARQVWECRIGGPVGPTGTESLLRGSVQDAWRRMFGTDPEFTFSGWGAELPERELAVVENREPLPAAAPDPATVLRSGPCATANCAFCTRDDCGCSCHDVTHAAPVPAGGEDGSGTADGNREERYAGENLPKELSLADSRRITDAIWGGGEVSA